MTRNNRSAISSRSLVIVLTALVVALWSGAAWAQVNEAPAEGNRADGTVIARADAAGADFDARLVSGQLAAFDDYGYAIVTADFNRDGFDDWAVGYPASDEVRVYFGGLHRPFADPVETDANPTASPSSGEQIAPTVISGPAGSHFGHALAAGDVDGNGSPDLIVGAPGTNDRTNPSAIGSAYVVWDVTAALTCPDEEDCETLDRNEADGRAGDLFGWSVAFIDLANPTIAVGAPRWWDEDAGGPRVGRVEFYRGSVPTLTDQEADEIVADEADVVDPDDRARLSRSPARSAARAGSPRFTGSRQFTARGRRGPGREGVEPPSDVVGALAPSFFAVGREIEPGGNAAAVFGEQLGESMAVCEEGGAMRLAVGAIAADAVEVLDPDDGSTLSTVLDPDLAAIDDVDRPGGLFGSNVVCGDFTDDPGDELVVAAVVRDWPAEDYAGEPLVVPRSNGGAVFLFDGTTSTMATLTMLPQSSGEFLGYALAAGKVFTGDLKEVLMVGTPRFDFGGPVDDTPACELDYANGAVVMFDLTAIPEGSASVILSTANLAPDALGDFVRHRVYGVRCGQAGGAVALGDLNLDGWAEVLTSTNVDPNEDRLRSDNPAGNAWIFSMNDADIDEGDDGANVLDPDDDNDCFADAWEDSNANGERDDGETGPFTPDINAVVSGLQVTCTGGATCVPGNDLTVSLQLNRSCVAIDDPRIAMGAGRAVVTLTLKKGTAPVKNDLALLSTVPAGGAEDDTTDPNAQIVTIDVLETDLNFPTPVTVSALLDVVAPVDAAFPNDLDIDVLVQVLDGGDVVILEARGTFDGNLVGRLDDNVDGPVNQSITATANPLLDLRESPCKSPFTGLEIDCLPGAIVPGFVDVWNDGLRNLAGGFGVELDFATAGFATGNTFGCPGLGPNPADCFPNFGVDCLSASGDGSSVTCLYAEQLPGATSSASPPLSPEVELQIIDDPDPNDATDWPAAVVPQASVVPVSTASVLDPAPPSIPVARPKASMTADCVAPCSINSTATVTLDIQNVGGAGTGPATVLFTVPPSTCDADQDPIPAGSCAGTTGASSPVAVTCGALQLIGGLPVIPCTFDETVPSNSPPITIDFALEVTRPTLSERSSASVYYPQCTDVTACPEPATFLSRFAIADLPLQAPFIQSVTVSCESGQCLPNGGVTYAIEIRNGANQPADTTVLIPIPAGTTCVGACFDNVGQTDSVTCVRSTTPDRLECAVDGTRRNNPTTFDVNLTIDDPPGVTEFTADVDLHLPQCTGAGCDAATPIDSSTETVPIVSASLSIAKTATPTTYSAVGDVIDYSYEVTNTGDVTITGPITIDDDMATDESCPAGDLAPAATKTCTATYTITQADLDGGSVTNVASASGTDPVGTTITSPDDTETVTAVQTPALTIEKSATPTVFEAVDDVIDYEYVVTNTGNVTITGPITVADDKTTDEACPTGDLAPGDSLTCTASYTIVAADVTAGAVTNVASASGTDPNAATVTSPTDTVTVNIAAPALAVVKSSTTTALTAPATVTYSYLVTNTGNVALAAISLSDDNDNNDMNCPGNSLAVGANMTCTATHTFTQAELEANGSPTADSGVLFNTVTASSTEAPDATDTLSIPITQTPTLTVVKSSTTTTLGAPATVDYSYLVTNTGNVSLTGISLSDDNDNDDLSCPATTLAVGADMTCTATHTFTQAELDANGSPVAGSAELSNTVTASSTEASDATDTLSIPITQTPALTMVKTAAPTTFSAVDDVIDYSYLVTNTGNVTISGPITIDDDLSTDEACPAGDLAPGASLTCAATYTIVAADITAGSVTNVASASGTDPSAATVTSPTDSETVTFVP